MGFEAVACVILSALALVIIVYGAMSPQKSAAIALIALVAAFLAAVGSWYAWTESASLLWSIGYGVAAFGAGAVGVRHLVASRS